MENLRNLSIKINAELTDKPDLGAEVSKMIAEAVNLKANGGGVRKVTKIVNIGLMVSVEFEVEKAKGKK